MPFGQECWQFSWRTNIAHIAFKITYREYKKQLLNLVFIYWTFQTDAADYKNRELTVSLFLSWMENRFFYFQLIYLLFKAS